MSMVATAAAVSAPLMILAAWQAIESPAAFDRFAGRYLLACLLTFALSIVAIKEIKDRARTGVRSLDRRIRREMDAGGDVASIESFPEPEFRNLAQTCSMLARRAAKAEEEQTFVREQYHKEMSRYESHLESVQMSNYNLTAESRALHALGEALSRDLGAAQICKELLTTLAASIEFTHAAVFLFDKARSKLEPLAVRGPDNPAPLIGEFLIQLPSGDRSAPVVARQVAELGRALCIADTRAESRFADIRPETRSLLIVPLRTSGGVTGIVQLEHIHRSAFQAADQKITHSMATTAAVAIENVLLLKNTTALHALQEVDRLRTELMANVSHELRTPLQHISGFAETLLRTDTEFSECERREFLEEIVDACRDFNEFIKALFQISQIEAGILKIERMPMLAEPVIEGLLRAQRLTTNRHQLSFVRADRLPAIEADEIRIAQVFRNLIDNAIKYSPEGGEIIVRAEVVGLEVIFSVSDSGMGIAAADLERIFERTYRVEATAVRRAGGAGLGLAICRGIIHAHSGRIWAESRLGEGSTFRFSVPLADTDRQSDTNFQEEPE